MDMRRFPICLTAILVSGCVSAATTVMTNPDTFEHIVCHRPGPTVGLGTGVVVQNLYETRYRQCIENAKNAGFLPPLNTGTDIAMNTSQRVVVVRGDAERAGIRTGDKLVKVEGFDMSAPEGRRGCYEHLAHKLPGDSITVLVERDGNQMDFRIKLPPADP